MLTILSDPAGITGRQRFPWNIGLTLHENIAQHLPGGGGDCEVSSNGLRMDPLTDPRMDRSPTAADFVTVARRPAGFETIAYLAFAALAIYTYTQIPKPPTAAADIGRKDSPNNALTGQTNIARTYQAIPDTFGFRRVWPDLLQPASVEYVENIKYVTEWLCIGRGKGTLSEVKYADTPIDDINGASWSMFEPAASPSPYPELNDTTLVGVVETFPSADVNNQDLAGPGGSGTGSTTIKRNAQIFYDSADSFFTLTFTDHPDFDYLKSIAGSGTAEVRMLNWFDEYGTLQPGFSAVSCNVLVANDFGSTVSFEFSNSPGPGFSGDVFWDDRPFWVTPDGAPDPDVVGPFTLPIECELIRWNVVFPRGLDGTVTINAAWWQIDEDGAPIVGTDEDHDFTYTESSVDAQFFTEQVTPSAGSGLYKIQFERSTADELDGSNVSKLESLFAVRSYPTKVLPGVTVIKVVTKATNQSGGFSDRRFNAMWLRHVRELDDDTVSESRNFARALAHVWALAGQDMAELDTDALQAINDDLGEDSALLRFDGTFDDADMSLGERLQRIAWHARCTVWRDGTTWTVTREQAKPYPELQLDYRNLAAGGESAISYAAHLPASHDGVEIEYVNEATQSTKAYSRLDISSGAPVEGTSSNPLKIKMPGCASDEQADNRAQLEARRLLYQRTSVSDTALADAGSLGVGSLVRWIDPNDFAGDDGLQAGEVMSIDVPNLTITTSEVLDWKGETTGRILFTGVDGQHLGAPIVCTPDGTSVVLASVPAGLYVRDDDRQLGSRYAFAVGLTEAEVEAAGLYTVTELRPSADRTISLSLAQYDERMFIGPPIVGAVGMATEVDSAFSLSGVSAVGVGVEADAALSLTGVEARAVGMAEEADAALALPGVEIRAVGMATEVNYALSAGPVDDLGSMDFYYEDDHLSSPYVQFRFNRDGTIEQADSGMAYVLYSYWYVGGPSDIGDSFEMLVTLTSGASLSSGTVGTWQQISSGLEYTNTTPVAGIRESFLDIEIRPYGGGANVGAGTARLAVEAT